MFPRRLADLVYEPLHAGSLDGAELVGQAAGGERLLVQVGLWKDACGRVRRARHRSTTCAALIAYAEVACALAEAGEPPAALRAERLIAAVTGAHPLHRDRAALVARALERALAVHSGFT
jgi:NifU-like protein involved in Fe-S cluster formation